MIQVTIVPLISVERVRNPAPYSWGEMGSPCSTPQRHPRPVTAFPTLIPRGFITSSWDAHNDGDSASILDELAAGKS